MKSGDERAHKSDVRVPRREATGETRGGFGFGLFELRTSELVLCCWSLLFLENLPGGYPEAPAEERRGVMPVLYHVYIYIF